MQRLGLVTLVLAFGAMAFLLGRWSAIPTGSEPQPDEAVSAVPDRFASEREADVRAQHARSRAAQPDPIALEQLREELERLRLARELNAPDHPDRGSLDWPEAPDMRVLHLARKLAEEGKALLAKGDLDAAEQAFRASLELVPDGVVALNGLDRIAKLRDR